MPKGIDQNAMGDRGEALARTLLTDFGGRKKPLFRVCLLGEKWPSADFYVEVVTEAKQRPYFFVQVKTSSKPPKANRTLAVPFKKIDRARLAALPAPTYLVGLDFKTERGYIRGVLNPADSVRHVSLSYPLTFPKLLRLREEVVEYWKKNGRKPNATAFGS